MCFSMSVGRMLIGACKHDGVAWCAPSTSLGLGLIHVFRFGSLVERYGYVNDDPAARFILRQLTTTPMTMPDSVTSLTAALAAVAAAPKPPAAATAGGGDGAVFST